MTGIERPERRIDAPWLKSEPLLKVFDVLEAAGFEARVVGGAVRDALLGHTVAEIDLATTALPQQTMRLAKVAGMSAHPTGIGHGTITIVANGQPFEVTTLRRDVETDGRRAVVAFTTDWAEDAARRDFTINGLSCARDGHVFDSVGGMADLDDGRVRFIGDAETRIREDYLRILRFFRFTSGYAAGAPDAEGLAASISLRTGLTKLSGERIGAELLKLLVTPRAGEITAIMCDAGILQLLIECEGNPGHLQRLQEIERALDDKPDPLLRLATLALHGAHDAKALAMRLRLSNAESAALAAAVNRDFQFSEFTNDLEFRRALYQLGERTYAASLRTAWVRSGAAPANAAWRSHATLPDRWTAPAMPVSGADVLALGVTPGPRVGEILHGFYEWWIAEDFPSDQTLLRAKLAAIAGHD